MFHNKNDDSIEKIWKDYNEEHWKEKLLLYYKNKMVVNNYKLEKEMEKLNSNDIKEMSGNDFYHFLHDKYFVWKFTAKNRLVTCHKKLEKYSENDDGFKRLEDIKNKIFKCYECDPLDTEELLEKVTKIHGLGVAGGSGLLSILFPKYYGTLDRFLVLSLREIKDLNEIDELKKMNEKNLKIEDGIILENILRSKAEEINEKFETDEWTPRKIDMILWNNRN